ncbi:MAG: hypothetical protein EXR09_07185 [Acetobacteraceae bacterium]|nr:hypothetical protein [Acetobacteraceae bacterium]
MQTMGVGSPAEWTVPGLQADQSWIITLDDRQRRDMIGAVRKAYTPDKPQFDYRRDDFDFASAMTPMLRAFDEARRGRGMAILRGMPREGVSEKEFSLMAWAIGLHIGVARPQGKASQYLSAVRNVGTVYRSATGRGYSSNADLDFHTDGADIVALTCYNKARSGGLSMVSSSMTAHNQILEERPDIAEILYQPFYFSRQAEEAPDEAPFYPNPVFDALEGVFCSKWNRNRINMAQKMEGVPQLTARQNEAMDVMDAMLRRPDVMYSMYLQPGDAQILSNHTTLHSRTEFEDFDELDQKRVLFRLWLAPAEAPRLPESWRPFFRSVEARTVRGGIIGHQHDDNCRAFEARQAADHGMVPGV